MLMVEPAVLAENTHPDDEIEEAILNALPARLKPLNKRDKWHEAEILCPLGDIAKQRRLWVLCARPNFPRADGPEWLCDQMWLDEDPGVEVRQGRHGKFIVTKHLPVRWRGGKHYVGQFYVLRAVLAAEVQFGGGVGAIFEDFYKLVLVRAEHRLMVFRANGPGDAHKIRRELEDRAHKFLNRTAGDRYLLVAYDEATRERLLVRKIGAA